MGRGRYLGTKTHAYPQQLCPLKFFFVDSLRQGEIEICLRYLHLESGKKIPSSRSVLKHDNYTLSACTCMHMHAHIHMAANGYNSDVAQQYSSLGRQKEEEGFI